MFSLYLRRVIGGYLSDRITSEQRSTAVLYLGVHTMEPRIERQLKLYVKMVAFTNGIVLVITKKSKEFVLCDLEIIPDKDLSNSAHVEQQK